VVNSDLPNCINVIDSKSSGKKTLCSMAMLAGDHQENINHWKDQMKFFAEKCFKTLPVVAANSQIVQLRTKQVQDAEAEASGASAAAAGNVDIGELMSISKGYFYTKATSPTSLWTPLPRR
jgi:hypothetical protein